MLLRYQCGCYFNASPQTEQQPRVSCPQGIPVEAEGPSLKSHGSAILLPVFYGHLEYVTRKFFAGNLSKAIPFARNRSQLKAASGFPNRLKRPKVSRVFKRAPFSASCNSRPRADTHWHCPYILAMVFSSNVTHRAAVH